jgi:hypothetical protein
MGSSYTEWTISHDIAAKEYGFAGLTYIDVVVRLNLDIEKNYDPHSIWSRWMENANKLAETHIHFKPTGSLRVYVVGEDHTRVMLAKQEALKVEKP